MQDRPRCPICGSHHFADFNGRAFARCRDCQSLERTRLLWLLLERTGSLRPDLRILHLAPERGLSARLQALTSRYVAADADPAFYRKVAPAVRGVDLCRPDPEFLALRFDLIIHMHVLEHVACPAGEVLARLQAMLAPGGRMVFSVPIRPGAATDEHPAPDLSADERTARFGQHDHLRLFGGRDVLGLFADALGHRLSVLDPRAFLAPAELAWHNVPDERGLSGSTIFLATGHG